MPDTSNHPQPVSCQACREKTIDFPDVSQDNLLITPEQALEELVRLSQEMGFYDQ